MGAARLLCRLLPLLLLAGIATAQTPPDAVNHNKFKQLYEELPTPNVYRTAAGAPGHAYWQQRADYEMDITLDDERQRIDGRETITYVNNSPDPLEYLWLQLDQNMRARDSDRWKVQTGGISDSLTFREFVRDYPDFDGGFRIEAVTDSAGNALPHTIVRTMMRVDLPRPLMPGRQVVFSVRWWYPINDRPRLGGRSGYEFFPEDGNYLYTIAQFFPRMAVYNDVDGWQHKQFLGRGEFTLPFGDYRVRLTVPADHVVGATGTLVNGDDVLTATQRERFRKARRSMDDPVMIVTETEARAAEKKRSRDTKTWEFHAENVRDFAFASSRKFIWDAMGVPMGGDTVMCMSYYPREGNPLWEQYSTRSVAHTIRVYSRYTFDYPYPVAISVHTDRIGMEYPMICFNGGRPESDGTYTERTKFGLISVIIHEVGHFFFPMIVNSDERQWTWMDEGLNSFIQFLAQKEWDRDFPSRRGPAYKIVDYMKGNRRGMVPIMTNSESIYQFGNNAYAKPAAALNILRETVLGRELFDFAFRTYSQRWMFKHPTPADFFRTMEDASGVDLDWFWRGWFYTTEHVDIAIDAVRWLQIDTRDPAVEKPIARATAEAEPDITVMRDREAIPETVVEGDPDARDFYDDYDPFDVHPWETKRYEKYRSSLDDWELAALARDDHFYEVTFVNVGGLVMPLVLEFTYEDGSSAIERIPAEIWRFNEDSVQKVFVTGKKITSITLDPYRELADVDMYNNHWPRKAIPSRFQLFKEKTRKNPMQRTREK